MEFVQRKLAGMYDVCFNRLDDHRGYMMRTFDADIFQEKGLAIKMLQHSLSYTERRNTVRGLHAQETDYSEAKLLIPLTGKMYWVSVDLRKDSPTFAQWDYTILEPEKKQALYVPRGFAHGCLSLSEQVLMHLITDNRFSVEHGMGIQWNDPQLGVEWPLFDEPVIISAEHQANPSFAHFLAKYGGL
ncbi:MAG: dTDP-4-dehydrorhamnose 3,5-epimerase family protein [Magnetococcales bacterium]|nr:dTDP-4-dehydrorhamnose 3,5-epimerase family protein [Magnetococcales bacterium]